jgi:hypothetical protein
MLPDKVRTVVLNGHSYEVPSYISRVDVDGAGPGTHGWQVRYRGTKFFSDILIRTGKFGTPASSLKEAVAYLDSIYTGRQKKKGVLSSGMKVISKPSIKIVPAAKKQVSSTAKLA